MKDAQVIHKLYIPRPEFERYGMLLGGKVQCVESLGLRLGDRRDGSRARKAPVACEGAARVLDNEALRV